MNARQNPSFARSQRQRETNKMDPSLTGIAGGEAVRPTDGTGPRPVTPIPAPGRHSSSQPTPGSEVFDRMEINTERGPLQAYAQFIVHPRSGVVSIKIIDSQTEKVIREIPSEQVVKIAEELQAYLEAGRAGKK